MRGSSGGGLWASAIVMPTDITTVNKNRQVRSSRYFVFIEGSPSEELAISGCRARIVKLDWEEREDIHHCLFFTSVVNLELTRRREGAKRF